MEVEYFQDEVTIKEEKENVGEIHEKPAEEIEIISKKRKIYPEKYHVSIKLFI
jgi:hypothetical protein